MTDKTLPCECEPSVGYFMVEPSSRKTTYHCDACKRYFVKIDSSEWKETSDHGLDCIKVDHELGTIELTCYPTEFFDGR